MSGEPELGDGPRRTGRDLAAIALLAVVLLVPGFFATELSTTDEARYTQVAREMRLDGRWLAPRLNGAEYWEKPALFFDLLQIPQRIAGTVTAVGSRLVILPFAILALWATYAIGSVLAGRRAGLLSAACLATMWTFGEYALRAVFDVPLLACTTGATLAYVAGTRLEDPPRHWRLAMALAMGVGCHLKGPVAILLPGAVAAIDTVRRRGARAALSWTGLWIPLLALATLALWFVPMWISQGETFADFMVRKHVVERSVSGEAPHARPFWFYIPTAFTAWLPWSLLLPAMIASMVRDRRSAAEPVPDGDPIRFPMLWTVTIVVILGLISGKRSQYLLPAAPGFALWVGLWADRALRRGAPIQGWERGVLVPLRVACIVLATAFAGALVAAPHATTWLGRTGAIDAEDAGILARAIEDGIARRVLAELVAVLGLAAWAIGPGNRRRAGVGLLVLALGFHAVLHWEVERIRDRSVRPNEFGAEVRSHLDDGWEVGQYGMALNGTYLLHARATHFSPLLDTPTVEAFLDDSERRAVIGKTRYLSRHLWPERPDREVRVLARHRHGRAEVVLFRWGPASGDPAEVELPPTD